VYCIILLTRRYLLMILTDPLDIKISTQAHFVSFTVASSIADYIEITIGLTWHILHSTLGYLSHYVTISWIIMSFDFWNFWDTIVFPFWSFWTPNLHKTNALIRTTPEVGPTSLFQRLHWVSWRPSAFGFWPFCLETNTGVYKVERSLNSYHFLVFDFLPHAQS